jgi:hypothetical protein
MRRRHVLTMSAGLAVSALLAMCAAVLAGCGTAKPATQPKAAPSSAPSGSATGAAATGGGTDTGAPAPQETNPPGDIPDNTAFVAYRPPSARYEIKVPEGWARTVTGDTASFTDKLNTVRVDSVAAASAPTVESARATEVPPIQATARRFALRKVETVARKAGPAVLITYQADSPVDPVTNKVVPDLVERYEFWKAGTEIVVTLSGPVNADNVDPWRTVTDSLRWLG